jgi:hypothetical protein
LRKFIPPSISPVASVNVKLPTASTVADLY